MNKIALYLCSNQEDVLKTSNVYTVVAVVDCTGRGTLDIQGDTWIVLSLILTGFFNSNLKMSNGNPYFVTNLDVNYLEFYVDMVMAL